MDNFLMVYGNIAYMRGIDHGGDGAVITRNSNAIVVKWPAHTYWASIGNRRYQPAVTCVYGILEIENTPNNDILKVSDIINWENTRKHKI